MNTQERILKLLLYIPGIELTKLLTDKWEIQLWTISVTVKEYLFWKRMLRVYERLGLEKKKKRWLGIFFFSKISFFQKLALVKNYLFWESTFVENVTLLKKLMLCRSTCFDKVAFLYIAFLYLYSLYIFILSKFLHQKDSCSEKVTAL